jgi:nitronate monooxygenase
VREDQFLADWGDEVQHAFAEIPLDVVLLCETEAAMGADFGYIGSLFIATTEAVAAESYKQMIVDSAAEDILYTSHFTGVNANYLKPSIRSVGLDPENLTGEGNKLNLSTGDVRPKAWRDIWGCGQGIEAVHAVTTTADYIDRESRAAKDALCS